MRFILITIFISSLAYANEPVADKDPYEEEEKFISFVTTGTDPRTCKDPDWCLYPSNFETKDCEWYRESI